MPPGTAPRPGSLAPQADIVEAVVGEAPAGMAEHAAGLAGEQTEAAHLGRRERRGVALDPGVEPGRRRNQRAHVGGQRLHHRILRDRRLRSEGRAEMRRRDRRPPPAGRGSSASRRPSRRGPRSARAPAPRATARARPRSSACSTPGSTATACCAARARPTAPRAPAPVGERAARAGGSWRRSAGRCPRGAGRRTASRRVRPRRCHRVVGGARGGACGRWNRRRHGARRILGAGVRKQRGARRHSRQRMPRSADVRPDSCVCYSQVLAVDATLAQPSGHRSPCRQPAQAD